MSANYFSCEQLHIQSISSYNLKTFQKVVSEFWIKNFLEVFFCRTSIDIYIEKLLFNKQKS